MLGGLANIEASALGRTWSRIQSGELPGYGNFGHIAKSKKQALPPNVARVGRAQGPHTIIFLILFILPVLFPIPDLGAERIRYGVQVASFKEASRAAVAVESLKQQGYRAFHRRELVPKHGVWHRVYLAGFADKTQARSFAAGLKANGVISDYYIRTLDPTDLAASSGLGVQKPVERAKNRAEPNGHPIRLESKTEKTGTVHSDCAPRPCPGDDLLEVRSLFSPNDHETGQTEPPLELEGSEAASENGKAEAQGPPPGHRVEADSGFGPRVRPTRLATWDVGGYDLVPFFSSGRVEDHYGWGKSAGGYDSDLGQEAILGLSLVTPF